MLLPSVRSVEREAHRAMRLVAQSVEAAVKPLLARRAALIAAIVTIDAEVAKIRTRGGLPARNGQTGPAPPGATVRYTSPETRAKMAAGQQRRWAKVYAERAIPSKRAAAAAATPGPTPPKGPSAKARAKMAAAAKRRWAAVRAAKAKATA